MFFVSGIFLVISATLVIMQNDRMLLGLVSRLGSVFRSRGAALKLGVAYPGAARSRTGMTIAMFSLIVFSLVMIATINLNFERAFLSDAAGAGWDIEAATGDRSRCPIWPASSSRAASIPRPSWTSERSRPGPRQSGCPAGCARVVRGRFQRHGRGLHRRHRLGLHRTGRRL